MVVMDIALYAGRDPLWWYNYIWEAQFDAKAEGRQIFVGGAMTGIRYLKREARDGYTNVEFRPELLPLIFSIREEIVFAPQS
jgi:hypothetical protein